MRISSKSTEGVWPLWRRTLHRSWLTTSILLAHARIRESIRVPIDF